jgi:hypothetical protein
MLHRYLDDALATAQASPARATEAHAALEAAARITGTRWLVEGGVVVVVACPREALRSFALRFPGE